MGEVSDKRRRLDLEGFASRWFPCLLTAFVRCVHRPALAYDLATEALAGLRLWWDSAPADDDAAAGVWLLEHAASVLHTSVDRGQVTAIERRRGHRAAPHRLTAAAQQEIARLAEDHLELPPRVQAAVEELARTAPAPHRLRQLELSSLIEAEPLAVPDGERHGA
jgi:hypothetical protein